MEPIVVVALVIGGVIVGVVGTLAFVAWCMKDMFNW